MTIAAQPRAAELGDTADLSELADVDRAALVGEPIGSPWQAGDRMFGDYESGEVFDYGDPNAAGIDRMVDTDGTAKQLEQVLTLPLRGADVQVLDGTDRGRGLVRDNLPAAQLNLVLDQQTSAVAMRKAFFELSWSLDGRSGVHLDGVAFRPATTCQAAFDQAGRPIGYRQRLHNPGGLDPMLWERYTTGEQPGWVRLPKLRSHIYTHGVHRKPLQGVSDLSVAYWAFETRRKLLYLWCQYLELHILGKVLAYGPDPTTANDNAKRVARLRSGGVVGFVPPKDGGKAFELLETGMKGADQFEAAHRYLEQHMVDSVLAGFTKLAGAAATSGRGSYALSADQSEFFLAGRQAVADEQAQQTSSDLFAKIVVLNGGSREDIPQLRIGPLSRENTKKAMELLGTIIVAPTVNAPGEFVDALLAVVAPTLGIDPDKLDQAIKSYRERKNAQAEQMDTMQAAAAQAAAENAAAGIQPGQPGQQQRFGPPAGPARRLATEVAAAHAVARLAEQLGDSDRALDLVAGRTPVAAPTVLDLGAAAKRENKDDGEHTGGMICLVPDPTSARRLALTGEKAEPLDQLHLTLAFLGDDVTGLPDDVRDELPAAVRTALAAAGLPGPLQARAFAHTTFNADGGPDGDRDPCAVYGIGDSDQLAPLRAAVLDALGDVDGFTLPRQHAPWVPHVTASYAATAAALRYLGPVTFDRVALVLGGTWTYYPLGEKKEDARG